MRDSDLFGNMRENHPYYGREPYSLENELIPKKCCWILAYSEIPDNIEILMAPNPLDLAIVSAANTGINLADGCPKVEQVSQSTTPKEERRDAHRSTTLETEVKCAFNLPSLESDSHMLIGLLKVPKCNLM